MPERIVRPGILSSDAVCCLSWPAEVFYRRLMSVADDYGRFDGRLSILRANLYPLQLEKVSDSDVGKWRLETAKAGLVRVYAVEKKEYVEIQKFDQRLRAKVSKWPSPPALDGSPPSDDSKPPTDADIRNGGGDGIEDGGGDVIARKRACQMPPDWMPLPSHEALVAEYGLNLAGEVTAFSDYHLSKGSTFKDWDRAFNTWLHNARRFGSNRVAAKPREETPDEIVDRLAREREERARAAA